VAVAVFEKKEVVLAIIGVWLSMILTSLQAATYNTLRGAEVTPSQFPAIYQIVQELCQRFQMPPTRVFICRKLSVEAEIFALRAPHVIALPSLLLDSLEPGQLRYVLGQAMGRIRFSHPLMEILLGGDESALPTVLSWIARMRNLIFAGYRRAQVLSADRIGILAVGSVLTAIEVQTKLSVGTVQMREVRADDLIDQAYRLTRGVSRLQAKLIALQSTTPPLIYRLEAMVEWAGLPSREQVEAHASNGHEQTERDAIRNKGENV
jgi:Peptidase family M48